MTKTALIVAAIAVVDSLNPSTIIPAVYLAGARSAVRQILAFSAGVFLVMAVGGTAVMLGPGQVALAALPHPSPRVQDVAALVSGIVLMVVALVMWRRRARLAEASPPGLSSGGRSTFVAGIVLMLIEIPTAFPYFAAIAIVVGAKSGSLATDIGLLVMFSAIFVLPLLLIAALVGASPRARAKIVEPAAGWLARHWPVVFAAIALAAGVGLALFGALSLT